MFEGDVPELLESHQLPELFRLLQLRWDVILLLHTNHARQRQIIKGDGNPNFLVLLCFLIKSKATITLKPIDSFGLLVHDENENEYIFFVNAEFYRVV